MFAPEAIGNPECPLIHRWTLINIGVAKLLVHHFLPDGRDVDYHDHPRSFLTFVFRGRYFDLTPKGSETVKAPAIRYRSADHAHKTNTDHRGAWSLVLMGRLVRPWGFVRNGKWMPWKVYDRVYGNNSNRCA